MKRQLTLLLILSVSFLFTFCRKQNQSVFYQVTPTTFTDKLTIEGTVESVRSVTISCPRGTNGTIISVVEDGSLIKKGDTVCILENKELLNRYDDLLANVESARAQYEKNKVNLEMKYSMLKAQVENNEAQTSITNLDSAQLQYLSPQQRKIKELELKKANIEKNKFEQKLNFLEQINASQLKKSKLQIDRNQNRADRIGERLADLVLIASHDGLVIRGIAWATGNKVQVGDQAWSGMPVATIPDLTEMKVTIQAPESAYKRIHETDKVEYTFDAMPGNRAWGKILKKAPMGKPISGNSKVKYFEITASVDSFDVIPEIGISANSKVILSQIPDTIVVPQLAIFNDDSINVVYVKKGRNFERREIIMGESSPREAVITAGLNGNEQLSYEKPKLIKITSTILIPDSLRQKSNSESKQSNIVPKMDMPGNMKIKD